MASWRRRIWAAAGATTAGTAAVLGWHLHRRARLAELTGQVALITGGAHGLGLLLARELGRQGCRLVTCARDPDELARARDDLTTRGFSVLAVPCDLRDPLAVSQLLDRAHALFGPIDLLVNNAGLLPERCDETLGRLDFERAMAAHFWGTVNVTMAVLPEMRARRSGRIVFVGSLGELVPSPHLLPHDCAEFAARGFSDGLRAELAEDGIAVTTVVPGRTSSVVAARQIVVALRRGETEVTLGWQTKLRRLAHALVPTAGFHLAAQLHRRRLHG